MSLSNRLIVKLNDKFKSIDTSKNDVWGVRNDKTRITWYSWCPGVLVMMLGFILNVCRPVWSLVTAVGGLFHHHGDSTRTATLFILVRHFLKKFKHPYVFICNSLTIFINNFFKSTNG